MKETVGKLNNSNSGSSENASTLLKEIDPYELRYTRDLDIIAEALKSDDSRVHRSIAFNKLLTISQINKLVLSEDSTTRRIVAQIESLPPDLIHYLADDKHPDVRAGALSNYNISIELLEERIKDRKENFNSKNWQIVSRNPHIPTNYDLFFKIWYDSPQSRATLIQTAEQVMFNDEVHSKKLFDTYIKDFINSVIADSSINVRRLFSTTQYISEVKTLDSLKDDSSNIVIEALASNPKTPLTTLEHIFQTSKSHKVRYALAKSATNNNLLNRLYSSTSSRNLRGL